MSIPNIVDPGKFGFQKAIESGALQTQDGNNGTLTFRPHRGQLDESMAQMRIIGSNATALAAIASEELGIHVAQCDIQVNPYGGYDHRTGWNAFIVTVSDVGVIGFTDGPIV